MNKICIHSLAFLAGALGCAAFADDASDLPSRELLNSYTYQPISSITLPDAPNPAVFEPAVAPDFATTKPTQYNWRDLEEEMSRRNADTHVLFSWNWDSATQWQVLGRPDIQPLNIPWSPMTTPNNSTLSPGVPDGTTDRLQARFPLVSLVW
jgi:hypothetical protein